MTAPGAEHGDWAGWIDEVAASVGVEFDHAMVPELMEFTATVARTFTRPMAPVSAFLWGYAQAVAPDADPDELAATILAALPQRGEQP